MTEQMKKRIFLVDDDSVFLKSLEIEFRQMHDFEIDCFASGESCLANLHKNPDIIILDFLLDGIDKSAMNGIQTLDKIKEYDAHISVIMLSGQDKIEVAVSCMHHLAFDYVVKNETALLRLQKAINSILELQKLQQVITWYKKNA